MRQLQARPFAAPDEAQMKADACPSIKEGTIYLKPFLNELIGLSVLCVTSLSLNFRGDTGAMSIHIFHFLP